MTKKLTQNNTTTHHGFSSGLMLGAVLGVAAYYLYGTEKGQDVKNQLLAEFEKARTELPPELFDTEGDPAGHTFSTLARTEYHEDKQPSMGLWERITSSIGSTTQDSESLNDNERKKRYFKMRKTKK